MTVVLDSGGLTMLTQHRARVAELRRRGEWPPVLPSVILVEALTGDHRRNYHENRLVRTCDVRAVDEAWRAAPPVYGPESRPAVSLRPWTPSSSPLPTTSGAPLC